MTKQTSDDLYPNATAYIRNGLECMKVAEVASGKKADFYIRAAAAWADLAAVAQRIEQDFSRGNQ